MLYSCMCVQILGNLEVNKITGHCRSKCFAHVLRCSWCVEGWGSAWPLAGTLGRQFCVIVFVIFFYHFLFYKSRSLYASVYNACQSHFVQYFKLSV